MSERISMSPVLAHLVREGCGRGVRIITRQMDWETRTIPQGENVGIAVGNSLVAFMVEAVALVSMSSDVWKLTVVEDGRRLYVYIAGTDIFAIMEQSSLA